MRKLQSKRKSAIYDCVEHNLEIENTENYSKWHHFELPFDGVLPWFLAHFRSSAGNFLGVQ